MHSKHFGNISCRCFVKTIVLVVYDSVQKWNQSRPSKRVNFLQRQVIPKYSSLWQASLACSHLMCGSSCQWDLYGFIPKSSFTILLISSYSRYPAILPSSLWFFVDITQNLLRRQWSSMVKFNGYFVDWDLVKNKCRVKWAPKIWFSHDILIARKQKKTAHKLPNMFV